MRPEQILEVLVGELGRNNADQINKALADLENSQPGIDWAERLKSATTIKECLIVFRNAPEGSNLIQEAKDKAFSITSCYGSSSYYYVFKETSNGVRLSLKHLRGALQCAMSVEHCLDFFSDMDAYSPEAYLCIQRMAEIVNAKENN